MITQEKKSTLDTSFHDSHMPSLAQNKTPYAKKKIWKNKMNISDINILTTKTLKLIINSKNKSLTPFWTNEAKKISEKLWLPTHLEFVDPVINSSSNAPMGKSWFSINKKHPQKNNSLMTSFNTSEFSFLDSIEPELITSKTRYGKPAPASLKTLKIRLFPTTEEADKLNLMFEQYRWYYNATVSVVYQHYGFDKISEQLKYSNI